MPTVMTLQGAEDGLGAPLVPRRRWIRSGSGALPWYDLWTGAQSSHLPGTGSIPAPFERLVEEGALELVGHCRDQWAPVWASHKTVRGLKPFASACHARATAWHPVRPITEVEFARLAADHGMGLGDFVSWLKQRNPLVAGAIVLGLSVATGLVVSSVAIAVVGSKANEQEAETSLGRARARRRRR